MFNKRISKYKTFDNPFRHPKVVVKHTKTVTTEKKVVSYGDQDKKKNRTRQGSLSPFLKHPAKIKAREGRPGVDQWHKIIESKVKKNKVLYNVKWKCYNDDEKLLPSEVPSENMRKYHSQKIIDFYEKEKIDSKKRADKSSSGLDYTDKKDSAKANSDKKTVN